MAGGQVSRIGLWCREGHGADDRRREVGRAGDPGADCRICCGLATGCRRMVDKGGAYLVARLCLVGSQPVAEVEVVEDAVLRGTRRAER